MFSVKQEKIAMCEELPPKNFSFEEVTERLSDDCDMSAEGRLTVHQMKTPFRFGHKSNFRNSDTAT